ncbi:hypothetical protein ABK040_003477 [Willaertia magna]
MTITEEEINRIGSLNSHKKIEEEINFEEFSHHYLLNEDNNPLIKERKQDLEDMIKFFQNNEFIQTNFIELCQFYFQIDSLYYLKKDNQLSLQNWRFKEKIVNEKEIIYLIEEEKELKNDFVIHIPSLQKDLHVHCKVLQNESKVFERMLNSEMMESKNNEMTLEDDVDSFLQMIDFIYIGELGIVKSKATENGNKLINIFDIINLLNISDFYQVTNLSEQISKVIHEYDAAIIAKKCFQLTEDTQQIIYPSCAKVISKTTELIHMIRVFREIERINNNQDSNSDEEEEEEEERLECLNAIFQNLVAKTQNAPYETLIENDPTTLTPKLLSLLPIELLRLILKDYNTSMKEDSILVVLYLWLMLDKKERLEEWKKLILECVDLSDANIPSIYHCIYIPIEDEKGIGEELKDVIIKLLIKKSQTGGLENVFDGVQPSPPKRSHQDELRILLLGLDQEPQ